MFLEECKVSVSIHQIRIPPQLQIYTNQHLRYHNEASLHGYYAWQLHPRNSLMIVGQCNKKLNNKAKTQVESSKPTLLVDKRHVITRTIWLTWQICYVPMHDQAAANYYEHCTSQVRNSSDMGSNPTRKHYPKMPVDVLLLYLYIIHYWKGTGTKLLRGLISYKLWLRWLRKKKSWKLK